jgi:hypothetical protein
LMKVGEAALTMVVWSDADPIWLPTVDLVAIHRDALNRRWLRRSDPDVGFLSWEEVLPHVAEFPVVEGPLPHRRVEFKHPPEMLVELLRGAPRRDGMKRLSSDAIIDADLLDQRG